MLGGLEPCGGGNVSGRVTAPDPEPVKAAGLRGSGAPDYRRWATNSTTEA